MGREEMSLRRLTQHLKGQHWTAVGLDFAVVVLGVFVALAVDSAVDREQERRATYAALDGLRSDIAADLTQWEHQYSRLEAQSESYSRLMDLLSGTGPITDAFQFVEDVQDISTYLTMDFNDTVLEELISTGNLRYISNRELRDALLDYRRIERRIREFDPLHRSYFLGVYERHAAQVAGGLSLPYRYRVLGGAMTEEAARAEAERVLDAEAIRSSDHLRQLVVATHAPWGMKVLQYGIGKAKAEELLTLLDAELGTPSP
jgi:hypothetical protein